MASCGFTKLKHLQKACRNIISPVRPPFSTLPAGGNTGESSDFPGVTLCLWKRDPLWMAASASLLARHRVIFWAQSFSSGHWLYLENDSAWVSTELPTSGTHSHKNMVIRVYGVYLTLTCTSLWKHQLFLKTDCDNICGSHLTSAVQALSKTDRINRLSDTLLTQRGQNQPVAWSRNGKLHCQFQQPLPFIPWVA